MGKKFALGYFVFLTAIMAGTLFYGFMKGDFWEDGGELLENPWGIVSLIDVYVGFFLFIGWVIYRESCPWIMLAWSLAILVGGNLVSAFYAVVALLQSNGNPRIFFLGDAESCCSPKNEERIG